MDIHALCSIFLGILGNEIITEKIDDNLFSKIKKKIIEDYPIEEEYDFANDMIDLLRIVVNEINFLLKKLNIKNDY